MMFIFQNKENKDLINAINFILGYKTKKPELFKLALLHKSIKSEESNERLEFLGDAVLGLIVAKYLFKPTNPCLITEYDIGFKKFLFLYL